MKLLDYNATFKMMDEIMEMGIVPVKEVITYLSNDERVDLYNHITESDYSYDADGLSLIIEDIAEFGDASLWINAALRWMDIEGRTYVIDRIIRLYDIEM